MSPIRRMSRRKAAIFGVIAALILALPMAVLASHQFTDVPNDHPFHADIDAIKDAGVTGGCTATKYCPGSFVTRGQMAAFLNRLGALQAGKTPVVNAAKLQGSLPSVAAIELSGSTNAQVPTTVDSFTVTAPGAGTLLVEVIGDIWLNADATSASSLTTWAYWGICTAANSDATCGTTYGDTDYQDADNVSSTNATPGTARARVIDVGAAGPVTLYMNAATLNTGETLFTYNTFAVVTFVPGASSLSISSTSAPEVSEPTTNRQSE